VPAGRDFADRRALLAGAGDVCISVEGGAGTRNEIELALGAGRPVIPLRRTGGASGERGLCARPASVPEAAWAALGDSTLPIEESAQAVVDAVAACCGRGGV
jgi:predicted Rossmann-fold nucleotide-binding protein